MGINLYISSEVTEIKKLKTDFKVSVAGNDFNFDKVVFTAPIQSLPHLMDLPSEFENKIERAIPWRAITIWLGINKQYFKDRKLHSGCPKTKNVCTNQTMSILYRTITLNNNQ